MRTPYRTLLVMALLALASCGEAWAPRLKPQSPELWDAAWVISSTALPSEGTGLPVEPSWPNFGVALSPPQLPQRSRRRRFRVYLDAGHGARGNVGASSAYCEKEQAFTLRVAQQLATALEQTGWFRVRISRSSDRTVSYPRRVAEAARFKADVFVSLHSDSRGAAESWEPLPGMSCPRKLTQTGFSILWSEQGRGGAPELRQALARALAGRMQQTGFPPYLGEDYGPAYDADLEHPGVFVSRPPTGRNIYLLRQTTVPSVLIETHQALHPVEALRWSERATVEAFGQTVGAALLDYFQVPVPVAPGTLAEAVPPK